MIAILRLPFPARDPLLDGIREKLAGEYHTSDSLAGHLAPAWAEKMGLRAGIPIPVGAFDAHWDAIGAGCRQGDVVNVVGTSTRIWPCSDYLAADPWHQVVLQRAPWLYRH